MLVNSQKKLSILSALLIITALASHTALGANNDELKDCEQTAQRHQVLNAIQLGGQVLAQLQKIDKNMQKQGRELNAAFIARAGTDPGWTQVLKDRDKHGHLLSTEKIYQRAEAEKESRYWSVVEPQISEIIPEMFADQSRHLEYSHMGLVIKNHPKGQWMMVHKLKPCDSNKSKIYDQGLATFFIDEPYKYSAQILVPKPRIQESLKALTIGKSDLWKAYWKIPYNVVAKPFQVSEVNSNSFIIEYLAAARAGFEKANKWPVKKFRAKTQEILKKTGYRSTKVSFVKTFKFALATTVIAPEFVDMSVQKYSDEYLVELISTMSIREYMQRENLLARPPIEVAVPQENVVEENQKERPKK